MCRANEYPGVWEELEKRSVEATLSWYAFWEGSVEVGQEGVGATVVMLHVQGEGVGRVCMLWCGEYNKGL